MTSSAYPNFKTHFAELFHQAGNHITTLDASIRIELARTKQASHGDYSCNLAMQLAKPLHKNPREIAGLLIDALPPSPYLEKVEVAGAGFINLFLKNSAKQQYLQYVLQSKE
ncbi:MAG: arginine--tRNA ligase, partial [Nitrosomonas sp.]|nr:arginine--tRNA ligase [Nitrosomonas sp.]